jgi:two-component sensor histidine kinase/putative methionine-R-sulfoxide reductase with GAF domain
MIDTTSTLEAAAVEGLSAELCAAATRGAATLETLGAELYHRGLELPAILGAVPPGADSPIHASIVAGGYLKSLAHASAMGTAAMRTELERHRAELKALQRVNSVATSSLDETTVLNKVVNAVADVMGVDVCSIYLQQGANQLVLRATYGLDPSAIGVARLLIGEGLTGWAAQQGKSVAVSDIWLDARTKYLPETKEDDYHSILSVPITASAGEQTLGVLNVQTRECRAFTDDEISFLEMISGQLGLSIENARSYGQTDAQLRQKVNALTTLHQVVVAVASSLDLRRVLNTIARQALSLCQGDSSVILARKGQDLRVEAHCGDGDLQHPQFVQEVARAAIQQGTHQLRPLPGVDDNARRSLLCVPLRGHGSTYGALAVYGKADQAFDGETSDLLTDFACEAAMAIENAQLHQATQQNLESKSVLLSELHHRVKNNLQTVASLLSLALRHSKSEEAGQTLRESYNRVRSIAAAHDLLSRQAIGVTTIGEVAAKVFELLEPTIQNKGSIKFSAEGDTIELETREATTLAILLNELLTNAIRHGMRGRESGTVRVLYGRHGSDVWVSVVDDGNGLPPNFTLNKNKGLGLSIVRTLVEADLHGQVNWAGDPGARFTLVFCPPAASAGRAPLAART